MSLLWMFRGWPREDGPALADYVMTVKANNPTLYNRLKALPWKDVPSTSRVTKDRGRRTRRTIKVALVPAWITFAGAAQIAQVRRTVTKKGKKSIEVVYLVTSDRMVDPATLLAWNRGHWRSRTSFIGCVM